MEEANALLLTEAAAIKDASDDKSVAVVVLPTLPAQPHPGEQA